MPVMRLTPQSIVRSFLKSKKKHLLLTGARGMGKSMLAKALAELLTGKTDRLPGITTFAVPKSAVILEENLTGKRAVIGVYENRKQQDDRKGGFMVPAVDGLEGLGREALVRCQSDSVSGEWVSIDELGYVEGGCVAFCKAVVSLMENRRVLAVLRKQHTPFLDGLLGREDVFVYDLDAPLLPVGIVVMASGLGRRFGGNKLLETLDGKTLIEYAMEQTERLYARRVVVTRHAEIARMCQEKQVDFVLHALPERSDTVRLGVEFLQREGAPLAGYLFCPADQPLLQRETLETMLLTFTKSGEKGMIFRLSHEGQPGTPTLFPSCYAEELRTLPAGQGGTWLVKKYRERVRYVEVESGRELQDIDTPEDLEKAASALYRQRQNKLPLPVIPSGDAHDFAW